MSSPSDPLLIALLAQRLPCGQRCETCATYEPDDDGEPYGYCCLNTYVEASMGCVYWEPREGCGLDGVGTPLASPLADE